MIADRLASAQQSARGDMTRPLRIDYPGAIYHITCRGNEHMG